MMAEFHYLFYTHIHIIAALCYGFVSWGLADAARVELLDYYYLLVSESQATSQSAGSFHPRSKVGHTSESHCQRTVGRG